MDFWNDNKMFVTQNKIKCGFKKYVKVVLKKKTSSNEKIISEVH
jgi:hypothetical protein